MSNYRKHKVEVYNKCGGRCAYCGEKIDIKDMQIDHKIAQRRGGGDNLDNLMPSCRSCNISKATFTITEFRVRLMDDVPGIRRDSSKFRILERFGLIKETNIDLRFWFEKCKED